LGAVTDPRSQVTAYAYDGLSNLNRQVSPDTGTTVNTFDAAGNLLTQTDAKGQVTTYAYDALNRITSITFQDGIRQTYAYDQGANGIGRLSSITETDAANAVAGQTQYAYDPKGRVLSEVRTLAGSAYTTAYAYDSAGRLAGVTYPSGRTVAYGFDALGRIAQVTTSKGPATQTVVASVAYQPFGGVKGYTLGNGQSHTRSYDLDGRIAIYSLGAKQFSLGFDAASRISSIAEVGNAVNTNHYGYDALDRLTQALLPNTNFGYAYDAVGNRQLKSAGAATELYTYAPTSNQLVWITSGTGARRDFWFDANGSTLGDGANQYSYDARGRLIRATSVLGTTDYQVNALGQRVRKANPGGDTVFHYDTRGRLIAESDSLGAVKREYLYLNDIPVAVIQ
jgi:YD repeat-containing protein